MVNYLLLFLMTVIGAFGAFFLKRASSVRGISELLKNVNFYIGGILYVLSAVINIYVLQFLPYIVVLPLTSITYIWTALIGWRLLKETLSLRCCIGIVTVVIGVIVLVTA